MTYMAVAAGGLEQTVARGMVSPWPTVLLSHGIQSRGQSPSILSATPMTVICDPRVRPSTVSFV